MKRQNGYTSVGRGTLEYRRKSGLVAWVLLLEPPANW